MFDGLLKSKFYSKCKSAIKRTRTRIEIIRRKRNAMQKYLKNDIIDLLKNGHDFNAYGRVEGFLVELNLSSCYDFVEHSCVCISCHLSIMNKQRECPEECREAIPSLMFAAARFSDLPELRDLRSIFAERYENSLEPYVNREFVEKLKSMPPTKDMKLRLMQDIALESGIEWDSKALEQKLYKPPASEQDLPKTNTKDNKYKMHKSRDESVWKTDKDAEYKHSNVKDPTMKERSQEDLSSRGRKEVINDKNKLHSRRRENNDVPEGDNKGHLSFEPQESSPSKDIQSTSVDRNRLQGNPKSAKSASKEKVDDKKHLDYRSVPPPYYIKPKVGTNETSLKAPPTNVKSNGHISGKDKHQEVESIGEAKPIPRSVRRILLKPTPGHGNLESANGDERRKTNSSDKQQDVKQSQKILNKDGIDHKDEEERVMDRLLVHYSKKQSPSEPGKVESALKQPPSQQDVKRGSKDGLRSRATSLPTDPTTSLPTDPTSLAEATNGHSRAASLESEMLNPPRHIHPMLPEYDDFVARLAALRGK